MTIDKSKTYRTSNGLDVRIYATDGEGDYPVHGAVRQKYRNQWDAYGWARDGRAVHSCSNHPFDLVEATRIHSEFWVNVYEDGIGRHTYSTKAHAGLDARRIHGRDLRLACIEIVIDCEEGDGL